MKQKKGSLMKQEKSGELQKLKNRIKRLEKQNRDLISKLNTAEQALKESVKFLKGSTEEISLEDLLEAAKDDKSLKEVKIRKCPKCDASEGFKILPSKVGNVEVCLCGYRGIK